MKIPALLFIFLLPILGNSQVTPPEKLYVSILKREKLSAADSKKLRIYLNNHMAAAFNQRQMTKDNQDILTYSSLYSLYEPNFRKDVELEKYWKQQSVIPKTPEAEQSESQIFEQLRKTVNGPEYVNTINNYYNFIKSFDLKLKIPFLVFRCNILGEVGQNIATKQCFLDVDKIITSEDRSYQTFGYAKYQYYYGTNDLKSARDITDVMMKVSRRVDIQNRWRLLRARVEYNMGQFDQANLTIKDIITGPQDTLMKANIDLLKLEILNAKGQSLEASKGLAEPKGISEDQKIGYRYYTRIAYILYSSGNLKAAQENAEKSLMGLESNFNQLSQAHLSIVALKVLNKSSISPEEKKYFENAAAEYKLYKADSSFLYDVVQAGYLLTQGTKPDPKVLEPILSRIVKGVPRNNILAVLSKLNFNLK